MNLIDDVVDDAEKWFDKRQSDIRNFVENLELKIKAFESYDFGEINDLIDEFKNNQSEIFT